MKFRVRIGPKSRFIYLLMINNFRRFQQNNPRSLLLKSMNQYGKVLVIASILVLVFFALQIKVEVGIFKKDKEFGENQQETWKQP